MKETIIILDFGGRYSQLLARRIRDLNIYCELLPYDVNIERLKSFNPKGIILTGCLFDTKEDLKTINEEIFEIDCPILGIDYGALVMANLFGASYFLSNDYAIKDISFSKGKLSKSYRSDSYISNLPEDFEATAHLDDKIFAFINRELDLHGMLFHPEVTDKDVNCLSLIEDFLVDACKISRTWNMEDYAKKTINDLNDKFKDKKVLLGLSGGVDSSVCAALVSKVAGKNLTCIFVDHGLLRKNEREEVQEAFSSFDLNLVTVDARERFLDKLAGVSDPETKRKIIGREFIEVFQDEASKVGAMDFFVQGTIYPDIIESGAGSHAVIKSHHNVGGLPDDLKFAEIVEPLKYLFKDEVRELGLVLGLPRSLVMRQPFPGPGLAIRVIGDITEEKLKIVRDSDYIFREEIAKAGLENLINQYFTVLTNMRSVGVKDGKRTYDYTLALRAVTTTDFMTAKWARIPYDVLDIVSARIVMEVDHVNRIVYDITGKPPATIEWE